MAYVELTVGSIIVDGLGRLEVVTSITRCKSNGHYYKVARTKRLHQTSKSSVLAYYWNLREDKDSYSIGRNKCVVNLTSEELARIRGDLNMLSKLLPKVLHINGVFNHIIDNKVPELIEEMKPKIDLRMEVRRILEDCIGNNYSLKHIYKSTRLSPDLRPMVSVLSEFLLIPGATKDSIDAAMTMNFGVGVFNAEGSV